MGNGEANHIDKDGVPLKVIVLVDEHDRQVGLCGKLETHRQGLLHRAFSVIIKNDAGQILLQQRAAGKYHSPGLWANACCGHPGDGDDTGQAARRRLGEEMGFETDLYPGWRHSYRADVGGGLIENEFVHVFFGRFNGTIVPDAAEAAAYRWLDPDALLADVAANPDSYSAWFRDYLQHFGDEIIAWPAQEMEDGDKGQG
ncbi:MAG: isopentenyl-diphosphate Delta-isomerase [Alphaproteobacteria bacterium]|nr:isopentenyl-diphosphate Delta-isomerase [Alphaproteobacteria bacterium]MDP6872271.1 isopentenyl-diphosphate Delta-isomerase [Alphaproteobacteria bacterium]